MKLNRWIISVTLALLLIAFISGNVSAANYSFSVDQVVVDVSIDAQGVMSIHYVYTFTNQPGASPIDFVDIGLPSTDYDISSARADVDGIPITDIQASQYVSGIALGLGDHAIQAGQKGTVNVTIAAIRQILYPDNQSSAKNLVSFNFLPNYFDAQYVKGSTDETVTLHLPPGIKSDEPIYFTPKQWPGTAAPQSSIDDQNRVTYTWQAANANSHTTYYFGAAFPASYVPASAVVTAPTPVPYTSSSSSSSSSGSSTNFLWVCGIIFFFAVSAMSRNRGVSSTRLDYLPPKISVEGHGIKRGLTAVEAAILIQLPLDKVLTMILFGAIKKSAAAVISKDPLKLEVTNPAPSGLYPYEIDFLNAFKSGTLSDQRLALQKTIVNLVANISEKMKGFSQKETVDYYKNIMTEAWQQVETAGTPEVKSQKFDENLEWTMLDRQFNDHTRTAFGQTPVFIPIWWGRFDPVYRAQGPIIGQGPIMPTTTAPFGIGSSQSMPRLPGSDFAASVVNGTSTFAAGAVGDLTAFTGGITNRTNPVSASSSGGGSHSCACACACAGCACACAGGGR